MKGKGARMKKRMIKSIPLEQGELYGIISGRRILLAKCNPRGEIMEHSTNVPILGDTIPRNTWELQPTTSIF